MKKYILMTTASIFMTSAVFTGCDTSEQKVENAQANLVEANSDLEKANEEYKADMESYRKEAAGKIIANNNSIAAFRVRVEKEKQEVRAENNKKLEALEQKNSDLKKKMDDYKAVGKENWEAFKTEFSHDLDGLGSAFQNLTVTNVK